MYKRDYTFRMNVMEEIFEIRSCIEILANDIKVLEDLHPSGGKNVLNMCDLFKYVYIYNFFGCNFTTQQCVVQSFCVKNEYVCMYVFNCLLILVSNILATRISDTSPVVIVRFSKTMKRLVLACINRSNYRA